MNSANLDLNLSIRLAHTTWVLQSQETPDSFYSFYVASLEQFHFCLGYAIINV